jgi:RNA polymerase sigma-70 factor (ECF subfamily)
VSRGRAEGRSFEAWYAEAAGPVLRRVAGTVGDAGLAREAAAEAFARAYERWGRVQHLDAPDAWVVTVAINLCRRTWRRRRLEKRAVERIGGLAPTGAELVIEPHVADDDVLRAAVDDLPPRMRDAVTLRYWDDLPEHEVAARMNVAPGTASALLSQARSRLRDRVEEES